MSTPPNTGKELREHNEYDELLTQVLMKEHAHDWDMETVREAALICSNTIIPILEARVHEILDELERGPKVSYGTRSKGGISGTVGVAIPLSAIEQVRKEWS